MNDGLLIIERIIIESLSKKERNLEEIKLDTNLDHALLMNVLPHLLMKNMIRYHRGIYSIDKENCFRWLGQVNRDENVKEEAKELFISLVNEYFKKDLQPKRAIAPQLKIQKMWLTQDEEIILRSHMATLENFFVNVKDSRKTRPQRERTCEQRVVIWGLSQYSDLVDGVLKAV